jgi:hypothetical protein
MKMDIEAGGTQQSASGLVHLLVATWHFLEVASGVSISNL